MDADSWISRISSSSSSSKDYKSVLLSRSDMFSGFEAYDDDEDLKEEFPCPFCTEYFDTVGLCCHIVEEHPLEARTGVCPICAVRVGLDMVSHITQQHGNILKMQRKRKSRKAASQSTLSLLKRELKEGNLQSLFGSSLFSSSNTAPDPLLSSFIFPRADDCQPQIPELSSSKKVTSEQPSEGPVCPSALSVKDKEETEKRSQFVRGLLFSTILDETL